MRLSTWTVSAVLLLLNAAAVSAAVEVQTDAGVVAGETVESPFDVRVFKGIPYAAPPVEENRWRAPQPVEPWSRTLKADEFEPRCIQGGSSAAEAADADAEARRLRDSISAGGGFGGGRRSGLRLGRFTPPVGPAMDEDCLYLNVWSGADRDQARLPVLVWFFGGDFRRGSGTDARYDGAVLASEGAVVVTFDYRLGALGFLAHPALSTESGTDSSGNYGLQDSIAALQWVKRNIAAFGGDPANVTAIGSASGAAMIAALIASPLGDGLFDKAILQSGWMATPLAPLPTLAEAERMGAEVLVRQEAESIADLRDARAQQLALETSPGLIVDGYVLTEDPAVTFAAGRQRRVAVLAGSNKDEGLAFMPRNAGGQPEQDASQFTAKARERFGPLAERYLELYPASSNAEATLSFMRSYGEQLAWSMLRLAQRQAAVGAPSYVYLFTREPPVPLGRWQTGATHLAEIPYVFGNLGATYSEDDRQLSEAMRAYWLNFARTGIPRAASAEGPEWPSVGQGRSVAMVFGGSIEPQTVLSGEPATFYDEAFKDLLDGIARP